MTRGGFMALLLILEAGCWARAELVCGSSTSKWFCFFLPKNSCHILLNWMLSLASLATNFPGSSAGDIPTEVPALHGKGIGGLSRAPCSFEDLSGCSSEQDPDLLFTILHKSFSFASSKPCITLLNYAFFYVLH